MVVAVPFALAVERDKEQVGSLQRFEHGLRGGRVRFLEAERRTQVRVEAFEQAGTQQEFADALRFAAEDFIQQIVEDVTMRPAQTIHESFQDLGVVASAAKAGGMWLKRKTGTGNIDLGSTGNDFTGTVDVAGNTATITDANGLNLGTVDVDGNLSATANADGVWNEAGASLAITVVPPMRTFACMTLSAAPDGHIAISPCRALDAAR